VLAEELVAVPGSHGVHDGLPGVFAYEPGSQDAQPLFPLPDAYCPSPQSWH
jgi:hypothetical protein